MLSLQEVQQKIKEDNQNSQVKICLSKVNSSTYLLFVSPHPQAKPKLFKETFSPEQALLEAEKIRLELEKAPQPSFLKEKEEKEEKEEITSLWQRGFQQLKCYLSLS